MASTPDLQRHRSFFTVDDVNVDDLRALVDTVTPAERYPNAEAIDREVVVYDMAVERSPEQRQAMLEELADVFGGGPGVVVMRNAVAPEVIARATEAFEALIEQEKADGIGRGDHFAAPGANDRVWNALEKLAVADPETFVDYYEFEALQLAVDPNAVGAAAAPIEHQLPLLVGGWHVRRHRCRCAEKSRKPGHASSTTPNFTP